jgi:hypothetical protein
MKFEKRAIALCATVLGVSLAIPSWGTAAMNGNSRQSPTRYAENSDMGSPRNVDDATLKRAAAAYVKVTDISAKTQQAMNSTDDATKKQQLAADSESAKLAAVKEEGMEPQQYNNVIQLVKADNTLQQKFLSYVQELKHSL